MNSRTYLVEVVSQILIVTDKNDRFAYWQLQYLYLTKCIRL